MILRGISLLIRSLRSPDEKCRRDIRYLGPKLDG